jgi:hypothetical protein
MNILKNMEAIFVVTLALVGSADYLADALPQANAQPVNAIATSGKVAVVTVSAKRMTAEEKAQSLVDERSAGSRS